MCGTTRGRAFPVAAAVTMHVAMVGDRLAASAAARLGVADPVF
jgi:hypothetical protein